MVDSSSHVVISCEGRCEEFVIGLLKDADAFVFPSENIIAITGLRSSRSIQQEFLNYDYDWPVTILRVADSLKERFALGVLYRDRFEVETLYTRPELEILIIIREGRWKEYQKVKSREKPSMYCKRELGMGKVKSRKLLEGYWDVDSLISSCREYKRLHSAAKGELCLADVLK